MTASASQTVLVTGAAGFVGRELCRQIAAESDAPVALRVWTHQLRPLPDLHEDVARFHGDILDQRVLREATRGVDTLYHLAGLAHVNRFPAEEMHRVNTQGTRALLDAAAANGVGKIVFFSSCLAHRAETGAAKATPYAHSKLAAERLLLQAENGPAACILRPVNVYGRGMKGNIRTLIKLIAARRCPPLPRLNNTLSLVGVGDLCRAARLAGGSDQANGRTYDVTDGVDYRINDIERAIYQALGRKSPRWHTPAMVLYAAAATAELLGKLRNTRGGIGLRTWRNLVEGNRYSNTAISRELGFAPAESLYSELPGIVEAITGAAAKD
ncbi:MAG: SDR family NAD(P)-dependent oxidoreductase [Pseudohongiellaceae bacterium]